RLRLLGAAQPQGHPPRARGGAGDGRAAADGRTPRRAARTRAGDVRRGGRLHRDGQGGRGRCRARSRRECVSVRADLPARLFSLSGRLNVPEAFVLHLMLSALGAVLVWAATRDAGWQHEIWAELVVQAIVALGGLVLLT